MYIHVIYHKMQKLSEQATFEELKLHNHNLWQIYIPYISRVAYRIISGGGRKILTLFLLKYAFRTWLNDDGLHNLI